MSTLFDPEFSDELEDNLSRSEKYRRITTVLNQRSDGALQLAFKYSPDDIDICYINETLLGKDLLPRIEQLKNRATRHTTTTAETATDAYGDLEMLFAAHTDVFILYFIASSTEGLIAVLDRTDEPLKGGIL